MYSLSVWYFIFNDMFKETRVIPFPSIPSVYLNLESVKGAGSNLIHILIYLAEY